MKRYILPAIALLTICACNNENLIKINGNINSANNKKVYLEQLNVENTPVIDSTETNGNGEFSFKTNVTEPTLFKIRFANKQNISLMLLPGESVKINGDYTNISNKYSVEGSVNSSLIQEYTSQLSKTQSTLDSLRKKYNETAIELYTERKSLTAEFDSTYIRQIRYSRNFVLNNAINPAMYYILYQKLDNQFVFQTPQEAQSFRIVASSMSAVYPESQYTKSLLNHYERIKNEIRALNMQQYIQNAEKTIPEIELANVDDNKISLLSLQGKYIILDFTVLSAKESESHINTLKSIYNKYKSKGVEIYQVCLDPDKNQWKQLVKNFGINWICVHDDDALNSRNAAIWNVQNIPANYIIDKKLDIVGKNLIGNRLEERLVDVMERK